MSLLEIRQLSSHTRLGLWHMDNAPGSTARQREQQGEQQLLTAMLGNEQAFAIGHEPNGKPFLTLHLTPCTSHLSISHTRNYVVMLISEEGRVGVDIEYRSDRVERIASRFIRPDEQVETTNDKLLLWSAKETVYKLFSEYRLAFYDMRALSIGERTVRMQNLKSGETVTVSYEFTDDYVLTYAVNTK